MTSYLAQYRFERILAEAACSISKAIQTLRDDVSSVHQSSATKTSFYVDNMLFESDSMAEYVTFLRPGASLFALIKFR